MAMVISPKPFGPVCNGVRPLPLSPPQVFSKIQAAVSPIFKKLGEVFDRFKHLTIFAFVGQLVVIPIYLGGFIKNCIDLSKDKTKGKIQHIFLAVENLRRAAEGVPAIVMGAEYLGAVTKIPIAKWIGPFGLAIAALCVVSIAQQSRDIHHARQLEKEIDHVEKANETSLAKLHKIRVLFNQRHQEDATFVKLIFNVDNDKLNGALDNMEKRALGMIESEDPKRRAEGEKVLNDTIKALKARVRATKTESALKLTAQIVNIIGALLLVAVAPFQVGWGVMGVAATINGAAYIQHKVTDYQFAKAIGIERKWHEWVLS